MAFTLLTLANCASRNQNDLYYGGQNFGDSRQYTVEERVMLMREQREQMRYQTEALNNLNESIEKFRKTAIPTSR